MTNFGIGDLQVDALAIGTMYFGTEVPTERAWSCLDTAYEIGARFWDTANNYAFWAGGVGDESEQTIGSWLSRQGSSVRDEVTIATKVGARPRTAGGDLSDPMGLSRSAIRSQVVDSLRRLECDYVDVVYAHIDDPRVPLDETIGALGELVDEGSVRAFAASNLTAGRLREALATPGPHSYGALQQRFTYLQPHPGADLSPHVLLDDEISGICERRGLARLGYSPLLSGAYTRNDRPLPEGYGPADEALARLGAVAQAHDVDAGQAVLAWMVGRAKPVIPVVGVSRPQQVKDAWHAVQMELSPAELTALEVARRG